MVDYGTRWIKYQISSFIVLEVGFEILDSKLLMELVDEDVAEMLHLVHLLLAERHPDLHPEVELEGRVELGGDEAQSVDLVVVGVARPQEIEHQPLVNVIPK